MTRLKKTVLLALLCAVGPLNAQTVVIDSLIAPSLGRMQHVTVLLPRGFDTTRTYAGLILLHGFGGDHRNWTALTHLADDLGSRPLVILMPDGDNSWYVNSVTDPANRYEDDLASDVVTYGTRRYHLDTTRLAIGGLSMGGYGALVAGLRHPDRFRFVIALSSSLDVPRGIPDLEQEGRAGLRPSLVAALGADSSAAWKSYDILRLVAHADPARTPYVYLATGISDEFAKRLSLHRALADSLRAHQISYEYHETPGRHNWEYWDREIGPALERLQDVLGF